MKLTSTSSFALLLVATASIFLFDGAIACSRVSYQACNIPTDWNGTFACAPDSCGDIAAMKTCLDNLGMCTVQDEVEIRYVSNPMNTSANFSIVVMSMKAVEGLRIMCEADTKAAITSFGCPADEFAVDRDALTAQVTTATNLAALCMAMEANYSDIHSRYTTSYNTTIADSVVSAFRKTYEYLGCPPPPGPTTTAQTPAAGTTQLATTMGNTGPTPTPNANLPPPPPACGTGTAALQFDACNSQVFDIGSVNPPCNATQFDQLCAATQNVSQCFNNVGCTRPGLLDNIHNIVDPWVPVPQWLMLRLFWNATLSMCDSRAVLLNNTQCVMKELIGVNATRFTPVNAVTATDVCTQLETFFATTQASLSSRYNAATATVAVDGMKKFYKVVGDVLHCNSTMAMTTANPGKNHSPGVASVLPLTLLTVMSSLFFMFAGRH